MTTTIPDSHRDLLDAKFAVLATVGSDDRPQATIVWFLAEADTIAFSLSESRQKTKNLRHHPACSVVVLDLENPFRYLELRGDVEISPDEDYSFAERVGAKYQADLRQFDQPGDQRMVARLRLTRVNATDLSH